MGIRTLASASLTFLLAVLVGCGTPVSKNVSPAELTNKAVVIVSVSHDVEFKTGADAIVYMDNASITTKVVLKSVQDTLSIPSASDFETRRGHLYVLEVNPGHHQFDSWQIHSAGVRVFPRVPPESLGFEAKAGEVIYLGNIHFRLVAGHRVLGGRSASGGIPMIVDNSDQDIPLAESKIPALNGRIRVSLLASGPWSKTTDTERRSDPIYIAPPPKK